MKLLDHIRARGLTFAAYGERFGVGPQTVWKWCLPFDHRDFRVPRPRMMAEIYRDSEGLVTPTDFYDLPRLPVSEAA